MKAALAKLALIVLWTLIVVAIMALLGAPGWALFIGGYLTAQTYSNQLQITMGRKEAARR